MTDIGNSRFVASESVAMAELADGVALLDLDRNFYFGLNSTGAVVWRVLAEPTSIDELCMAVAEKFAVTPAACKGDIVRLVEKLVSSRLARVIDAPG